MRKRQAAACLLLAAALAGCGKKSEPDPVQQRTMAIESGLGSVKKELSGVEVAVRSQLVSDPQAKQCRIEYETKAFENAFTGLDAAIDKEIAAADALATSGKVDPRWPTAAEQVAAQAHFLEESKAALEGASTVADLLKASIGDRPGFMDRANKAYYAAIKAADDALPWANRARETGGPDAEKDKSSYETMLSLVANVKMLHARIADSYVTFQGGGNYDCSNWAVDVTKSEKASAQAQAIAAGIKERWSK